MIDRNRLLTYSVIALAVAIIIIVGLIVFLPRRGSATGFSSNGQRIYFTLTSSRNDIAFAEGPDWYQGNRLGCVACHAPDARGSFVPIGEDFRAPDIRFNELTRAQDDRPGYTEATIRRAITDGVSSDGKNLGDNMPRYKMERQDVNDVIDFLKTTL